MVNQIELKVGKKYLTDGNEEVVILSSHLIGNNNLLYRGSNHVYYNKNGTTKYCSMDRYTIISEIEEKKLSPKEVHAEISQFINDELGNDVAHDLNDFISKVVNKNKNPNTLNMVFSKDKPKKEIKCPWCGK